MKTVNIVLEYIEVGKKIFVCTKCQKMIAILPKYYISKFPDFNFCKKDLEKFCIVIRKRWERLEE